MAQKKQKKKAKEQKNKKEQQNKEKKPRKNPKCQKCQKLAFQLSDKIFCFILGGPKFPFLDNLDKKARTPRTL